MFVLAVTAGGLPTALQITLEATLCPGLTVPAPPSAGQKTVPRQEHLKSQFRPTG